MLARCSRVAGAKQIELANVIVAKQLSVRETEAAGQAPGQVERRRQNPRRAIATSLALEEELSDALGTRVTIVPGKKGSGKLVIDYTGLDHLDTLLTKLRQVRPSIACRIDTQRTSSLKSWAF